MMKRKAGRLFVLVLTGAATFGCASSIPALPTNPAQYDRLRRSDPSAYATPVIVMRNIQRVLDGDLSAGRRVDSLALIERLGGVDKAAQNQLAVMLSREDCPADVHRAVLEYLLKRDVPGLGVYVVRSLTSAKTRSGDLQKATLQWLISHPNPSVLAEVVRLWAAEPSRHGESEPTYRYLVEKMTGSKWDQALLDCLNASAFFARGSALRILVQRIEAPRLRKRISAMVPRTDAIATLQTFVDLFNHVPANGTELLPAVWIYKSRSHMLAHASDLCRKWTGDYGYRFNIRDFHLLSRLATDPLRKPARKARLALKLDLAAAINARKRAGDRDQPDKYSFRSQAEMLHTSDLWNLHLLNRMLTRSHIQLALRLVADRQRAGRPGASQGLVFYKNGRLEPKLFLSADPQAGRQSDSPSRDFTVRSRDALCRFRADFAKVVRVSQAAPNLRDLRGAREGNYYGLILAGVSKASFCAYYYNPEGMVVSLGVFPFGK